MDIEGKEFHEVMRVVTHIMASLGRLNNAVRDFGTGQLLSPTEIHTVEAIGQSSGINVTGLAKHMGVTKGAVSQMVDKLMKKGLVRKTTLHKNMKEVILELTDKGWIAFEGHEKSHSQVYQIVREYLGDKYYDQMGQFREVLGSFRDIMEAIEQRLGWQAENQKRS